MQEDILHAITDCRGKSLETKVVFFKIRGPHEPIGITRRAVPIGANAKGRLLKTVPGVIASALWLRLAIAIGLGFNHLAIILGMEHLGAGQRHG